MNKFNLVFVFLLLASFISCNSIEVVNPESNSEEERLVFEPFSSGCVLGDTISSDLRVTAIKGDKTYGFSCFARNFEVIERPNYTISNSEAILNGERNRIKTNPAPFRVNNLNKAYTGTATVVHQEFPTDVHEFRGSTVVIKDGYIVSIGGSSTEDFVYASKFTKSGKTIGGVDKPLTYWIINTIAGRRGKTTTAIYLTCQEDSAKTIELVTEHPAF